MHRVFVIYGFLLFLLFGHCRKTVMPPMKVGFVIADKLYCREAPDRNSLIKTAFVFGQIVSLGEKAGKNERIGKIEGEWIRNPEESCWLFSGYLRIDSVPDHYLSSHQIICNLGTEVSEGFKPLMSSSYFLTVERLDDWAKGDEYYGAREVVFVTIGRYERKGNELIFRGERTGVFKDSKFLKFETNPHYAGKTVRSLVRIADEKGEYYQYLNSIGDRRSNEEYCRKFPDLTRGGKPVFFEYYTEERIGLSYPFEPLECGTGPRKTFCSGWNYIE